MTYDHLTLSTLFLFNSHIRLIYLWICFISAFFFFSACAAAPADILFLLDSSRSEGSSNFQTQKDFVSKFVNFLNIGPNDVQVTVGTFSTAAYSFFNLNTFHHKTSLLHAISQVSITTCSISKQLSCELSNLSI